MPRGIKNVVDGAPHVVAEPRTATVRAQPVIPQAQPAPKEPPVLVQVRALERGQYGLDLDIIVRNEGEVFNMATSAMRKFPLAKGEHAVEDAVIINVNGQDYELPGWVELVSPDETVSADALKSHGHAKGFRGQATADGERNMDVM